MRRLISMMAVLALAGPVVADSDVVDVIIVAGQSNAVGAGNPDYLSDHMQQFVATNENVRYCYWINNVTWTSEWKELAPRGGYTFGVEMMIGHALEKAAPDRELAIMKVAYDGTSLACDWNPNDCSHPASAHLYDQLKSWMTSWRLKIENEGKTCNFAGFVWIQGESDIRGEWMAVLYESLLRQLIDGVRIHANNPDMAAAVALIKPRATGYDFGETVRGAIHQVAADDLKVTAVTCEDLPLKTDIVHFTAESQIWLGGRMADALLALDVFRTGDPPPPPPPVDTCPGDVSGDGLVGATDILLLLENWGYCP
ncbi:MAG: sialate O-acetylesterase [Phycisphaerales bacterium]|nr:sialate O-acetylesterase [Phycisphaerales bacterium]